MVKDQATEDLIKEKAKSLFFQKGFLDATTQEIADEAKVNRALIHYYFRSREQLMDVILEEVVSRKRERVLAIFTSDLTFREKIAVYIDAIVDQGLRFPYLENFIISETARSPKRVDMLCSPGKTKTADLIREDLAAEIKKGKLRPISAEHFMVNLSSMCNYPLLAKSILKSIHGMTDQTYRKFLQDRKQIIYRAIFQEEMPEVELTPELKSILTW
ncbi:MAG TPA: TetR/AcrR family transcriptional regulator [Cyclobacteriaceae bacterium]|nr:TetR/AcrR family transcriptional regulator [Cyclobacteriaceae bacterium]